MFAQEFICFVAMVTVSSTIILTIQLKKRNIVKSTTEGIPLLGSANATVQKFILIAISWKHS